MEYYKNLSLSDIDGEIWIKIDYTNDAYSVSNYGRIKSNFRNIEQSNKKIIRINQRILKQKVNKYGYLQVAFMINKKIKSYTVHRIVAYCFLKNILNLPQVNHKDSDRTNNILKNLEWVSNIENCCHSFLKKEKKSKYIGVTFCKDIKKWRSKIYFQKKQIHLGVFELEIEAHLKRLKFEKENKIQNRYNI